ncbi:Clavaminate synthase-like protein [Gonapodya prolifera JEL478]|uniref:Clavaminate synthase-like protein n=1 Tax=Gonapodya prolifera (strain JEL478) TaxID=1344416 RepID=A0A139AIV5_GONPJ|nr:Clavaminate synthase-like protein [Gonapodya prolifera JEL478]|eukprot:KXS16741.1 Clavaminate synthase-like protein [Gonapodya prolifera JEL478]
MATGIDIQNVFHFEPFTNVPILDLALADKPETKPVFISWLRYALLNTGNWYLVGHGVDDQLLGTVKELATKVFDLPANEENRLDESNSPHFWGLTRVGRGTTEGKRDYREDFDLGNDLPCQWKEGDPLYVKTRPGPNLWPSKEFLPDFKKTYQVFIAEMTKLGDKIEGLIEEALELPKGTFAAYKDENVKAGGRVKIARYPPLDKLQSEGEEGPKFGVGPHKDLWLTFTLPANEHAGQEVANPAGSWIPCPPLSGMSSFVVHIGSALESISRGSIVATPHRAMNPASGTSHFTVYYLHEISPHVTFADLDKGAEGLNQELVATAKARRRWWILRNSLGKSKLQNLISAAKRTAEASSDSGEPLVHRHSGVLLI